MIITDAWVISSIPAKSAFIHWPWNEVLIRLNAEDGVAEAAGG